MVVTVMLQKEITLLSQLQTKILETGVYYQLVLLLKVNTLLVQNMFQVMLLDLVDLVTHVKQQQLVTNQQILHIGLY